ncbi:hypothetical protein CEXT_360671 [Caerostris extrusa]|uniref:Uncharacterized protein n=1 Tax=Caerostris extrusa TaxID=172846 RepID=A0AAV4XG41_CAEEX|nr:hypothetical protein CEXT_360671 [Caerostris extrusa]
MERYATDDFALFNSPSNVSTLSERELYPSPTPPPPTHYAHALRVADSKSHQSDISEIRLCECFYLKEDFIWNLKGEERKQICGGEKKISKYLSKMDFPINIHCYSFPETLSLSDKCFSGISK